jgi:CelD/BcsL family acetyltransferase involved in cellulose biosynthesis
MTVSSIDQRQHKDRDRDNLRVISIKTITNPEDLRQVQPQWDQVLQHSFRPNIFQSWNWVSNWIETYLGDDRLLCLIGYEGDTVRAIAPLWVEKVRFGGIFPLKVLQFIGSREICADHLDFIMAPKYAPALTRQLWDHLYGPLRKKWDIFMYHDVPGQSPMLTEMSNLADRDVRCIRREVERFSVCPYVLLPDSYDEYLTSVNSKQRRNLKVAEEALAELGEVTLRCEKESGDVTAEMDRLIGLYQTTWSQRGERGSFASPRFSAFHRKVAEGARQDGSLFLCSLWLDQEHLGTSYSFIYENVIFGYIQAVRKLEMKNVSVGRVLLARCIKEAIARGCCEYDLLRGAEPYKYFWTDIDRRNLSVTFYNRNLVSSLWFLLKSLGFFSKQLAKVVLGRRTSAVRNWMGNRNNRT